MTPAPSADGGGQTESGLEALLELVSELVFLAADRTEARSSCRVPSNWMRYRSIVVGVIADLGDQHLDLVRLDLVREDLADGLRVGVGETLARDVGLPYE